MEEGNSDKNTETDWKNTYEEQMRDTAPRNNYVSQNIERKENLPSIQKNKRNFVPPPKKSSKKKIVIILTIIPFR